MDTAAIDRITDRIVLAIASGERVPPPALRFLLRRFAVSGRDDLRDLLGPALANALGETEDDADPDWRLLLAEAVEVSDDPDLRDAVERLAARCRATWPGRGSVAAAAAAVEFCLAAGAVLPLPLLVAEAIDELERMVGMVYEPGDGVAQTLTTRSRMTGDLATHVAVALALLRAYDASGRLAYPMLAEELMYGMMGASTPELGMSSLEAAGVLARLARLQRDPDYRAVAVTREDAAYAEAAERQLRAFDAEADPPIALAAVYGLALEEWLRLT